MKKQELAPRLAEGRLAPLAGSPFSLMRRLTEDMERFFEDFGPRTFFEGILPRDLEKLEWAPAIEILEKDTEIIVRADLPGLTKDDVKVEITDEALTLSGERKQEREEKKEGIYRTERTYGSFLRRVPLPEGVKLDAARATFRDGVLEVIVPTPARQRPKARKIEIETKPEKPGTKAA